MNALGTKLLSNPLGKTKSTGLSSNSLHSLAVISLTVVKQSTWIKGGAIKLANCDASGLTINDCYLVMGSVSNWLLTPTDLEPRHECLSTIVMPWNRWKATTSQTSMCQ